MIVALLYVSFNSLRDALAVLSVLPFGLNSLAHSLLFEGDLDAAASLLAEAGLLQEDAPTVSGRTIGEEAAAAQEADGQEVIRQLADPLKPTGGFAVRATLPVAANE